MRKVYAIGESLIDIIFSKGEVKAAKAGGSMLNSSISLGRAGMDIIFLSEYGQDNGGKFISDFLNKNNVQTRFIHQYTEGKTPMALAFLNEKGDASYDFYKIYPKNRLQLELPPFEAGDIFLFGSFFGIDPAIREPLMNIVHEANRKGALIVYDPNFRKPHAHELPNLLPFILENIALANIIKGSNEDMEIIFGQSDPQQLRQINELKEKTLIITHGADGAVVDMPGYNSFFQAQKIKVVSTIGAGDNFNAGLIYGLINQGINPSNISQIKNDQWEKIIRFAMGFASNVCMSYENYISPEFAESLTAMQ
jgi:fructokinase